MEHHNSLQPPPVEVEKIGQALPTAPTIQNTEIEKDGIVLIPHPTNDPGDPLNWPTHRKSIIVFTLCLATFTGFTCPFASQLNLIQQSKLYHKEVVEITYANSAASAGLATGGFIWLPLSYKFGKSSTILWTLLGLLAAQIWAPLMTHPDQYGPYIASRYFAGFFGMVCGILGPCIIVELFFLHQRGRAFTVLHLALNLGGSVGPTFSGFIAANAYWPVEYWWTVALVGVTIVFVFLFLEETGYPRGEGNQVVCPRAPNGFLKKRLATFFPGSRIGGCRAWRETAHVALMPFKIAIAPVALIIGLFDTISFAFYIAMNSLTPVWLHKPVKAGGYGFTVADNAACKFSFVHWIGLALGLLYGHFLSDRIPLWLASRHGGLWKPEFRLYALFFPSLIFDPIGLGLMGVALQYKLHWIVLAIGQVFITFGGLVSIPITVNYICECFTRTPTEATLPVHSIRLLLGLSINFYINPWVARVTIGWVYGMMAFFSVASFLFVALLMWKGHEIRKWTPFWTESSEEGERVIGEETPLTDRATP